MGSIPTAGCDRACVLDLPTDLWHRPAMEKALGMEPARADQRRAAGQAVP